MVYINIFLEKDQFFFKQRTISPPKNSSWGMAWVLDVNTTDADLNIFFESREQIDEFIRALEGLKKIGGKNES